MAIYFIFEMYFLGRSQGKNRNIDMDKIRIIIIDQVIGISIMYETTILFV